MTLGLMIKGIQKRPKVFGQRGYTRSISDEICIKNDTKLLLRQLDSKKFSPPAGACGAFFSCKSILDVLKIFAAVKPLAMFFLALFFTPGAAGENLAFTLPL